MVLYNKTHRGSVHATQRPR